MKKPHSQQVRAPLQEARDTWQKWRQLANLTTEELRYHFEAALQDLDVLSQEDRDKVLIKLKESPPP